MFCFRRDFFPSIDAGQIQLHVRAPAATRIEETERIFQLIEKGSAGSFPEDRGSHRRQYWPAGACLQSCLHRRVTIGVNDGVILVSLKDGHVPTADYVRELRRILPAEFPKAPFTFRRRTWSPRSSISAFPPKINVRTVAMAEKNLQIAQEMQRRIAAIPGIADAHLQQELFAPPCTHRSIGRALPNSG